MPDAPDTGRPRTLRPGRYYDEADLASAADAALKRKKVTQTAVAAELGLEKPNTVSMALRIKPDPDNPGGPYVLQYPGRGFAIRRHILRRYAGLAFDGDSPTHTPAVLAGEASE